MIWEKKIFNCDTNKIKGIVHPKMDFLISLYEKKPNTDSVKDLFFLQMLLKDVSYAHEKYSKTVINK